MSAMQRRKGASGEREWCAELAKYGVSAKRELGQARDSGGDVAAPPYLFEVKRHARFSIYEHMEQAIAAAPLYKGCQIPVVALRGNQKEWLVVMRAEDFLKALPTWRAPWPHARHEVENLL